MFQECIFCQKVFNGIDQSKLSLRMERHLSNHKRYFQKQKYKCQFCIFGTSIQSELVNHICQSEPTSVIAENPLFKVSSTSFLIFKKHTNFQNLPQGVPHSVIVQHQEPVPIPSVLKTADFDVFDDFSHDLIGQPMSSQNGVSVIRQSSVIVSSKKHESVIVSPPHSFFHYPSI